MKSFKFFLFFLFGTLCSKAQTSSIEGTFNEHYIANMSCPAIAIFEPQEGHFSTISEISVGKPDYRYKMDFTGKSEYMDKILFAGYNGEYFPFYMKKGEQVRLAVSNATPIYGKNLCKENKVFAGWFNIIQPLHHLSLDKNTPYSSADSVLDIVDKTWKKSEKFIAKIKTGNKVFDDKVRFMLPYEFMYEALRVFGTGWMAPTKDKMPEYFQHIFAGDNFNTPRVWKDNPFATDDIVWYASAKHILCEMKQGQTFNYAIEDISDPYVKQEFLLYSMEAQLVGNPLELIKICEPYITTDANKARLAEIKRKASVIVPGNGWVDMEYPDKDGKMHKLSEFLGKVVVIDVWATWCPPCRAELPYLVKLEKEMQDKDVVFIGYSIDQNHDAWLKWIQSHNMVKVQLWTGNKGPIIDDYRVNAVPQFIVFSKDGKLVSLNAPRPSGPELKELREKELAK